MAGTGRAGSIVGVWLASAVPVLAHPHVFVDARMTIQGDGHGRLTGLTNVWAMDELFSASVIPDFDANANGKLDKTELAAVGEQVRKSIAEWSFYTFVKVQGEEVALLPPKTFQVEWDDRTGKLLFRFDMQLRKPINLTTTPVTLTAFDKTYFVAFDFPDAARFTLKGMPAACHHEMVAPTPDEAEKIWMDTLSKLSPDEAPPEDGINFSEALATRLEVDCRAPLLAKSQLRE